MNWERLYEVYWECENDCGRETIDADTIAVAESAFWVVMRDHQPPLADDVRITCIEEAHE